MFDKSEYYYVRAMARYPHLDNFIRLLQRKLNGQTAYDDHHHRHVEPLQQARANGIWRQMIDRARTKVRPLLEAHTKLPEIGPLEWTRVRPLQIRYKDDIYTNTGMTQQSKLCTGETSTSFGYMECGTGNVTPEGVGNNALDAPLGSRIALVAGQTRFASGTSEKYAGTFPANHPTGNVVEFGVFDAAAAGNCIIRAVFSPAINHVINTDIFVLASTVTKTASAT